MGPSLRAVVFSHQPPAARTADAINPVCGARSAQLNRDDACADQFEPAQALSGLLGRQAGRGAEQLHYFEEALGMLCPEEVGVQRARSGRAGCVQ
jgi:hypothetical protein